MNTNPPTLTELKCGTAILPAPIYVGNPYVLKSPQGAILATGTKKELRALPAYFDEFVVDVRQHDLAENDNTRLSQMAPKASSTQLNATEYIYTRSSVNRVLRRLNLHTFEIDIWSIDDSCWKPCPMTYKGLLHSLSDTTIPDAILSLPKAIELYPQAFRGVKPASDDTRKLSYMRRALLATADLTKAMNAVNSRGCRGRINEENVSWLALASDYLGRKLTVDELNDLLA
jgi:hypothetical protein